ncbi:MAG: xanthine dehydrogenase family protein subunit M [Nocardioides sp.]|nr:xanthine dehydrogenase family protein subunit M [Nocardioides sp.]
MKPAPFSFVRPQGLQHALEALAADPGAKVLAGGQSLVPLLSMRLAAPSTLVDINALPDLDHVRVDDSGVRVGALARQADVLGSDDVRRVQPLLSLALSQVAHATIRNRGTVVGSLVHADAAAELPMVLTLLGGSVSVASATGTRTIPAAELYAGPLESTLHHDEIAVEALFPGLGPGEGVAFEEVSRRHGDYALCGVAAVVRVEGAHVAEARVGYMSVADVPTVVDLTTALVEEVAQRPSRRARNQGELSDQAVSAAAELALQHLDPADDLHASSAYRAQLVRVLTAHALRAAHDDAVVRGGAPG